MNQSNNLQLFPKSLIWDNQDGQLITNSLMVAKYFGKKHKNILRDIEVLRGTIPDAAFSWLNFEPRNYLDQRGKVQPMYLLTKDGFYFLTMGFTGQKALQWKLNFLNAFNEMEVKINEQTQREANALHYLKPHWRLISDGLANNLSRKAICELTGHRSPQSITANKRRMREAGVLHSIH